MEWFSKWFNEDYELIYPHRNSSEANQMVQLFQNNASVLDGLTVLDMCCGLGRVSFELAKYASQVYGFDLSSYFIEKCKERESENIIFQEMDMRDMSFDAKFDVIFHIFTSFGYFETEEENISIFEKVNKALKPGGYYFFDFFNENYVRNNLQPITKSDTNDRKIIQKRIIESNRVIKEITIDHDGEVTDYKESVMLINKESLENAFSKYHFEVIKLFGNYDGEEFDKESSSRLIYILRKHG